MRPSQAHQISAQYHMSEELSASSIRSRLDAAAGRLTPQERRLAAHLLEHLDRWGYLSSTELADNLSVHRSTVVRFAQNLGFKGFTELREGARVAYLRSLATSGGLVLSDRSASDSSTLEAVYQKEQQNLERSYRHLDLTALEATAAKLAASRRVVLFGRRFSHPIALHLGLVLRTMRERVEVAPVTGGTAVDLLFDLGPEDFVLAVSLRRHSQEAQSALRYLSDAGVPVTVLTDAFRGSDLPLGTRVLRAHVGSTGVLDSYTALISLSHAILTLTETALPNASARLGSAENAWRQFNKS